MATFAEEMTEAAAMIPAAPVRTAIEAAFNTARGDIHTQMDTHGTSQGDKNHVDVMFIKLARTVGAALRHS